MNLMVGYTRAAQQELGLSSHPRAATDLLSERGARARPYPSLTQCPLFP